MAGKLSGKLSSLIVDESRMFDNPFQEDSQSPVKRKSVRLDDYEDEDRPRKKRKKSSFEKAMEYSEIVENDILKNADTEALDRYLSEYAIEDEDSELRASLLSHGRKYARETKVSPEVSEIAKTFSGTEKMINGLLDEVTSDLELVQKDINQMRSLRTGRNYKALTDLQLSKKELYNVKMSAIKELNSMKKAQIELQAKAAKEKAIEGGESEALVNQAIGSLLSSGRGNALSTVGGYAGVSGAIGADEDYEPDSSNEYEDDYEEESNASYVEEEDEGRAYLKYENRGVELVLVEKNGKYAIVAEDSTGEVIPDYPTPKNPNSLTYRVNEKTQTAMDDYHRRYKYRKEE